MKHGTEEELILLKKIIILPMISIFILTFAVTGINAQMAPEGMAPQEEVVVATIDGEEVYMQEVEQRANIQMLMMELQQSNPEFAEFLFASPEGQEFMTAYKREQLDNLIGQRLLENEAEKEDISLSEEYKDKFFEEQLEMIKEQQGMSEEDILEALAQQGIESMDEFKDMMIQEQGDQLLVRKLIEEVGLNKIDISEQQAKEFYEEQQIQVEFEQVKDDIIFELAREEYVSELKEEAEIEIKEEKFETTGVPEQPVMP